MTSSGAYDTLFTHTKAGMEGVDQEKIKQLVFEMSKGSAFAAEQARRDAKVDEQIAERRRALGRISATDLEAHRQRADSMMAAIDSGRSLTRTWCCVDMDAFFAACEALEDPSLRGDVPFAVGGIGMISTASYAARRFGVRSAMPGFIAKRLCQEAGIQLRFVPCDHAKYQRYAELSRTAFRKFDANFIAASCDEAFLDLTDYCARHGVDGTEAAARLRGAVLEATGGLTCSVGIAPSRVLAKVCSDINKPNGQHVLPPEREAIGAFLSTLPLRRLHGIGRVAERVLREVLGAKTCGDLLERRAAVHALFSPREARFYLTRCLGIGGEEAPEPQGAAEPAQKGVSQERTFEPTGHEPRLRQWCSELAERLEEQLITKGLQARTLTLKLKQDNFRKFERTATLPSHVGSGSRLRIAPIALARLEEQLRANRAVGGGAGSHAVRYRLMGLRVTQLRKAPDAAAGAACTLREFLTRNEARMQEAETSAPTGTSQAAAMGSTLPETAAASSRSSLGAADGAASATASILQMPVVTGPPGVSGGEHTVARTADGAMDVAWVGDSTWGDGLGDDSEGQWEEDWLSSDDCGNDAGERNERNPDDDNREFPTDMAERHTGPCESKTRAELEMHDGTANEPVKRQRLAVAQSEIRASSGDESEIRASGDERPLDESAAVATAATADSVAAKVEAELVVQAIESSRRDAEIAQVAAAAAREWACGACTLINSEDASRCVVCDAIRGGSLPAAATLAAQHRRDITSRGAAARGRGSGRHERGAPAGRRMPQNSITSFLRERSSGGGS